MNAFAYFSCNDWNSRENLIGLSNVNNSLFNRFFLCLALMSPFKVRVSKKSIGQENSCLYCG